MNISKEQIGAFSKKWKIATFSIFGSVARGEETPTSDVDVLVDFLPTAHWTLFNLVDMRDELIKIFGRKVDLVTLNGIKNSSNPIRKNSILTSAKVVYEQGSGLH